MFAWILMSLVSGAIRQEHCYRYMTIQSDSSCRFNAGKVERLVRNTKQACVKNGAIECSITAHLVDGSIAAVDSFLEFDGAAYLAVNGERLQLVSLESSVGYMTSKSQVAEEMIYAVPGFALLAGLLEVGVYAFGGEADAFRFFLVWGGLSGGYSGYRLLTFVPEKKMIIVNVDF